LRPSAAAVGLLALAACTAAAPPEAAESGPSFDPVAFFIGPSHGEGRLDQMMKGERRVRVESVGRKARDGAVILDQRVAIEGDPVKVRRWVLRQTGPGRYGGSLTDATGPVEAVAIGRAIRIRYPMKGGLKVEQWLVALPGGRALDNRMTVTKWGMKVATLRERIEKR
jgi:hypothetical protein